MLAGSLCSLRGDEGGVLNFLVFVSLPLFVSSFVVYAAYCAFTLEAFVPLGVVFGKSCLPPIGWF